MTTTDRGVSNDRGVHWSERGLCRSERPEVFFPHRGDHEGVEYARSVCRRCPVIEPCLRDALVEPEQHGVRGGMAAYTRTLLLRRRGPG